MPDRWGRPTLQDGLSLAGTIGGMMHRKKQDALEAEALEREKRVKGASQSLIENKDYDLSELNLDEKYDVSRNVAIHQSDQLRMDREFEMQKAKKRSNSRNQYLDGLNKAEMALNNGDAKTAAYLLAEVSPHAPTGWGGEVQEDPETGEMFLMAKNRLTEETESIPVTEESIRGMVNNGKKWRSVPDFDEASKLTDRGRRELNETLSGEREILRDKAGNPRGVRYQELTQDETGALTQDRRWVYRDENLQEVPAEQMAEFTPDGDLKGREDMAKRRETIANAGANFAKAGLEKEKAVIGRSNLFQPDPGSVYQNQAGGFIGKTGGGQIQQFSEGQAKELMPMEESKYNQVTAADGEYTFIKQPGSSRQEKVVKTDVKAPGKSDDQIYTVRNRATGRESQLTEKQIRANMKANISLLKEAKTDNRFRFDMDQYLDAAPEIKKTMLGHIEELMRDANQSSRIRDAAGQILGSMEALGMTGGASSANGGLNRSSIKSYLDRAKKELGGEQGAAVIQ